MTEKRAQSFCKCVSANSRFTAAEVCGQNGKFFVYYEPTNPKRREFLFQKAQADRIERAKSQKDQYDFNFIGHAWIVVKKKTQEQYEVSEYGCSCPDFQNRGKDLGIHCKHMKMTEDRKVTNAARK